MSQVSLITSLFAFLIAPFAVCKATDLPDQYFKAENSSELKEAYLTEKRFKILEEDCAKEKENSLQLKISCLKLTKEKWDLGIVEGKEWRDIQVKFVNHCLTLKSLSQNEVLHLSLLPRVCREHLEYLKKLTHYKRTSVDWPNL